MDGRQRLATSRGWIVAVSFGLAVGLALIVTGYFVGPAAPGRPSASGRSPALGGGEPSPSASASPSPPTPSSTVAKPDGIKGAQWTFAAGRGARSGTGGRLLRYRVAVENATNASVGAFAAHIQATFDNSRGWTRSGKWSFQRVSSGTFAFTIWLATPGTTDKMCRKYGLDTGGVVSCRGGPDVVINLIRWTEGIPAYPNVSDYDHLVINHEAGHYLGHGHVGCPGAGRPAPVMMTQYYGLNGCVPNVWPYRSDGTFVTGPAKS